MEPHIIELTEDCDIYEPIDFIDRSYADVFSKHDHLILILEEQMFEGDFVAGSKNRIEIINVREHNNPNRLGGIYYFYKNEIMQIRRIKIESEEDTPLASVLHSQPCVAEIKLCEEEYERHQEMYRNYVFIDKRDHEYHEAIRYLSEVQSLGVVTLGIGEKRALGIGLLVLSTWDAVYLFDLTTLKNNGFHPEIKQLFENESVCKVFHRGGPQIDVLKKIYNVHVVNTFDTEIVDLIIEKNKSNGTVLQKTRNISECLTAYFNFPASLLREALETKNSKWFNRPLSDRRKMYASQLGTYLILLKEKMEKIMFSEINRGIQNVLDYYCKLDDFTKNVQSSKVSKEVVNIVPILSRHGIDVVRDIAESKNFLDENLIDVKDVVKDDLELQTSQLISLSLDESGNCNGSLKEEHRRQMLEKKIKKKQRIQEDKKRLELKKIQALLLEERYCNEDNDVDDDDDNDDAK